MEHLGPISIDLIKKAFLKLTYQEIIRTGVFHDFRKLLVFHVRKLFDSKSLSDNYFDKGKIAVSELERDGYIEKAPGREFVYRLTPKGITEAKKEINEMKLPYFYFHSLNLQPYLVRKVYNDYKVGDFDGAIFKACKHLEETVRAKARLPASIIGVALMDTAFKKKNGLLRYPYVLDEGEQEGLHHMMRGTIGFLKNPSSHRTVVWEDPNDVMYVITTISFLLDIVNKCELVEPRK